MTRRVVTIAALAVMWATAVGCSYPKHRFQDAAEMFDFGATFSKKPQFSAYMNCPVVAPIGYGKVDGRFVGVGGGKRVPGDGDAVPKPSAADLPQG